MKKQLIFKLISSIFILLFLTSCASYNTKSLAFQNELQKGNVEAALIVLEKNKFLQKKRNLLLYYFEKRLRLDVAAQKDRPSETPVIVENWTEFVTARDAAMA